jgi:hypothetical protein
MLFADVWERGAIFGTVPVNLMNVIQKNFTEIIGKPCWGVKYDCQTNLSLNFGNPYLSIEEPFESKSENSDIREHFASRRVFIQSDYFLWIYIARWKIIHKGKTIATTSSSYSRKMKAIGKLDGQILEKVQVNPNTGKTEFEFDLGCKLLVQRWSKGEADELWAFYKPDDYVLSVYGNGFYTYQVGTDKNEKFIKLK